MKKYFIVIQSIHLILGTLILATDQLNAQILVL